MTENQMNRALRGLSKTFSFKALQEFVEKKKVEIALELLSANLDSPEAKQKQGQALGMTRLLVEIENVPSAEDDDES